jgi:hypothetical protein
MQGIDAGDSTFEDMLPEYWLFLEWLIANRINELVWIVLEIVQVCIQFASLTFDHADTNHRLLKIEIFYTLYLYIYIYIHSQFI